MRWRASSYADTNSDHATESYGNHDEYPYADGHTNRYAGAANADAANIIVSNANCDTHAHANGHTNRYPGAANNSGSNASCDAHALASTQRHSGTDRGIGDRVA